MQRGELLGTISIDTISNKEHLFGLGPLENLAGEILVTDGFAYQSKVVNDSTMQVEETFDLKAPFFVYMNVEKWSEVIIPDSIVSLQQLESFLDQFSESVENPFAFRLMGFVESATIHIVNLPTGAIVKSPQDAHEGQVNFTILSEPVEIVGFFSRKHQSIFTHHDSYVHMHLITDDKNAMGHLDDLKLQKGLAQLWVSYK
jgi:acetolactate decarboxylase